MTRTAWAVARQWNADLRTPGRARDFCRRRLASVLDGLDGHTDSNDAVVDAATVAHELVLNAVQAQATRVGLWLGLWSDRVRIEVVDDAPGLPQLQRPSPTQTRGRGLLIVDALSTGWGADQRDDAIKLVWAEVPLPETARRD